MNTTPPTDSHGTPPEDDGQPRPDDGSPWRRGDDDYASSSPSSSAGREALLPGPDSSAVRGRALSLFISWTVIILLVSTVAVGHMAGSSQQPSAARDPVGVEVMKLQSRLTVAQEELFRGSASRDFVLLRKRLNTGTIEQRLYFTILAGELVGPSEAREVLLDLDERLEARTELDYNPTQQRLRDVLESLYADYEEGDLTAASVSEDDRDLLREEMGWFGRLALLPRDTPHEEARQALLRPTIRTLVIFVVMLCVIALAGLAGLAGLIILFVFASTGQLRRRIGPPLPYGHIYAETFAGWMLFYLGISTVVGHFVPISDDISLLVSAILLFLSLGVLIWPVLRGIPWLRVREDIGLFLPRKPLAEPFIGVSAYAMTLPLLGIGLLGVLALMAIHGLFTGLGGAGEAAVEPINDFSPTGGAAHPLVQFARDSSWFMVFQLYLIAAVAAPIVEEIIFRGVLYRHLRSLTGRRALWASIVISTLINTFIFAIIHPQGIIAAPALMALAAGMCLAREWRGSLIAPITIHAVSNGLVTTMLVMFASG